MLKYVEFATKSKPLVRYEIDENDKLGKVEVFKDGFFVEDYEIREIVERAVEYRVTGILGKELTDEEAQRATAERIGQVLDEGSRKR